MTIEIPLTQGKVALIDDADLPLVEAHKWCVSIAGYVTSRKTAGLTMHRLLLDPPDGVETDHIDGNKLNNQRSNLRGATHQENCRNRSRRADNTSGYKGVTWNKAAQKWYAGIWLADHKHIHLGTFVDPLVAARAYDDAARKHFGEFAKTNF